MLQPGEEIGGYVLVARLAEDSASTLLLVRKKGEDGVSAHRAMRILTPAAASSAPHRNAFFQRARATLDVRVTGLAGPLDLGEHRGLPYVVTEYVHGVSVRQLFDGLFMTKRRLRPDVAAYVGLLIAQALDEAHDLPDEKGNPRRLIHGAITPHRVILSFDGTVRLVGFGVAKPRLANTEIDVVRPSRFGYTAPEVLRGEPADTRADVFSLAVVLWEALTMRRCFAATSEAATLELMSHPQVVPRGSSRPACRPRSTSRSCARSRPIRTSAPRRWTTSRTCSGSRAPGRACCAPSRWRCSSRRRSRPSSSAPRSSSPTRWRSSSRAPVPASTPPPSTR